MKGCLIAVLSIAAIAVAIEWNWSAETPPPGYGGDPQRGRAMAERYGCPACHVIPGLAPRGEVGPALDDVGTRSIIAGHFPNRPIEMAEWIRHPQEMKPGTLMPDTGVGERDARDIAAFLATLR